MTRGRSLLCGLACLGLAGAAGYTASYVRWSIGARPAESSPLVVAPGELDLGTRYETTSHEHHFRIENRSAEAIRVLGLTSTCDCLGLTPSGEFVVQPGEERVVRATVALRADSDCQKARREATAFRVPIRARYAGLDGGEREQIWQLTANVQPVLRLSQTYFSLGLQSVGQADIERSFEIDTAPHVRRIECLAPMGWTVLVPDNLSESNRALTVVLKSRGPLSPRVFDDRIVLTPINASRARLPRSEIRVQGEFVEDLLAHPRGVTFGRRRIGDVVQERVRITSLSGQAFVVEGLTVVNDSVSFALIDGLDGVVEYAVRQRVVTAGEQVSVAFIRATDGRGKSHTLSLPISYFGTND